MKKIFFTFWLILFAISSSHLFAKNLDVSTFKSIAILDQGRIKPFDTFARESVQNITGKIFYEGKDPTETILQWMSDPEAAIQTDFILARYTPLNQKLSIPAVSGRIAPGKLLEVKEFKQYLKQIVLKQQQGEKLDPVEKEANALFARLDLFYRIINGQAMVLFPSANSYDWQSLDQAPFSPALESFKNVIDAVKKDNNVQFTEQSIVLKKNLNDLALSSTHPAEIKKINWELQFNHLRPFQKAWILYLVSFFLILISILSSKKSFYYLGIFFAVAGTAVSIYGFVIRCLIAGRPPVSNMYESVIWVSFGAVIFALIFEAIYKSKYFLLSGTAGATLGLLLADFLPNVLDASIHPLVPVLRSNYWLTVHVLTITLSYAAFMLGTGVAQVAVGFYAFKPSEKEKLKALNLFLYRCTQVGVVLLAAGTILGGVWANASWGRFWGWDPKEVWALIALLGYLAILHGRFAGWLRDFGFAVWSILSFLLVLMAWYGVNFILGAGLHSYGFSSGGLKEVSLFVASQLAWVLFATYRYRSKSS